MTVRRPVPQRPDDPEVLRKRLNNLEAEFHEHVRAGSRGRAVTAGFSAGAVTLCLSAFLPWVRSGTGPELVLPGPPEEEGSEPVDQVLELGQEQAFATGWELLSAGALVLPFLSLAVLLLLAVSGLFFSVRPVAFLTVFFAPVPPLLCLLMWPAYEAGSGMSAGPGLSLMMVGCAVVALSAYRSTHGGEGDRPHWRGTDLAA
jgi:hypothetical protein